MIDGRRKQILKEFGKNLKRIRKEKKIALRELAAMAEMEHSQISKIEAGTINLTLTTIVSLADALEVPTVALIGK
jgi:transcriptional regulator with XRE-family HTH domain